jgi:hypothetical protein
VQAKKLHNYEEQKNDARQDGNEEILSFLSFAQGAPRNEISRLDLQASSSNG